MEDIDKLQITIENIDRLIHALIPFVSSGMQQKLLHLTKSLEPMKHLKDLFRAMEMMQRIQSVMNVSDNNGTPDISILSEFLNPEQMQMFEMFQNMQDLNI